MSIRNEIVDCLKNFPEGAKVADIRPNVKEPANLARTLWYMKKIGEVSHNTKTHLYKLLTPVNKTSGVVKDDTAKAIIKLNTQIDDYKKTLDRADVVYAELSTRYKQVSSAHDQLKESHTDALAIIRYLENKLYTVIKTNRANGNA